MAEQQQNSLETLKQNLVEYVKLQLGDQIIDIELDPAGLLFHNTLMTIKNN